MKLLQIIFVCAAMFIWVHIPVYFCFWLAWCVMDFITFGPVAFQPFVLPAEGMCAFMTWWHFTQNREHGGPQTIENIMAGRGPFPKAKELR